MTVNRNRFYLGPLGAMSPLPPLPRNSNPDGTPMRVGGIHQSLSGRTTLDNYAYKRVYQFGWTFRTESELQVLISAYRKLYAASTRLVDLRWTNQLSAQVASGGSEKRLTLGFTPSAGTLVFGTAPSTLPSPLLGALDGCVTWTPTASTQTLLTSSTEIPVISGSYYWFSAYGYGSGNQKLRIQPYDASGAALTANDGSAIALATSWSQYTVGPYYPPSNAVSLAVGWVAQGSGTLNTTGWGVQVDQQVQPWAIGAGSPTVVIPSMTTVYPRPGYMNVSAVVQEV